jgi:hypothetical protein
MALATHPYYRSTYVVSKPDEPPVSSLDDPSLRTRPIGVQLVGDDGSGHDFPRARLEARSGLSPVPRHEPCHIVAPAGIERR